MLKINRKASVGWEGGLKDGRGTISTASGALADYPYGFASRFEGVAGSNPEELLGAAHAACFTMATSLALGNAGYTAERMDTSAEVTLEQVEGGFAITGIKLVMRARVPNIEDRQFRELAETAKANCPLSKALASVPMTLDAELV
ncbi:OsmC family protein [Sphingosinicella ginsenosidimutans]